MALKLVANDYLQSCGYKNIKYEQEFEGYVPDVIVDTKTIIIECGNTNPDKIFNYFKNKNLEQFIILPYPTFEEQFMMIYIFEPNEDLADFLLFREKELLHKAVIKKKNTFQK
ncbi:MAG: hypothetical protein ABIJ23_03230 [Candidatus Magasanikbacteria bacterium]